MNEAATIDPMTTNPTAVGPAAIHPTAVGPAAVGPAAVMSPDRTPAVDTEVTVMVVDDEPVNIKVVARLLDIAGHRDCISVTDSREAIAVMRRRRPDIILLDVMMPGISGLDLLRMIREDDRGRSIPVVVLSAATDRSTRVQALDLGANDFLGKPIDPSELVPRVGNLLRLQSAQRQLRRQNERLEAEVARRTGELEASRRDLLHCLARAAEYRDDDTGFHVLRVGHYARTIARALSMDDVYVDRIEQAAQLHDVGKIGVPDAILHKPGRLTAEEYERMKRHAVLGKQVLERLSPEEETALRHHAGIGSELMAVAKFPILDMAHRIALTHHEWFDGSGYPLGLAGDDIPLEGRITAVADVFDALSSKRCYKDAMPLSKCFEIMTGERGTHFDPEVLDAFLSRRDEIVAIQMRYAENA